MNIPSELKFTNDHEWIRVEGGNAFVGITDFAQGELGDIVFLDIPSVGKSLKKGDVYGTVEAVKTVSDMFMPVAGDVLEKNSQLESQPELVNKDPYGNGWMVKIKISNASELSSLLSTDDYKKIVH